MLPAGNAAPNAGSPKHAFATRRKSVPGNDEPDAGIGSANKPLGRHAGCFYQDFMSHVVEVNHIEQLGAYRLLWKSLFAQTRGASFFQTLDWLETYWRHFGENQKLRVLIVSSRGTPIGIVPLTVIRERTRVGRIRVLTYPLHDWGTFYGPIGPNPTATLLAAMRHIRDARRDYDMLDLRWTDTNRHDRHRTQRAMQLAGFQGREAPWKETAIVDVSGTWDDFLRARPSKFRENLRRARRRVERLGGATHVRYRPLGTAYGDGDPRWDLYDACADLTQRTWQGASRTGTALSHESVRHFFRATHAQAAKSGMIDVNLLMLRGRAIAFCYNYHHDGYVCGLRAGYDPELAHVSPGHLLLAEMLRHSFDGDDHTFDLGPGSSRAKRPWTTRVARSYRYTHYSLAAPRSQLLRLKHWIFRQSPAGSGEKRSMTGSHGR